MGGALARRTNPANQEAAWAGQDWLQPAHRHRQLASWDYTARVWDSKDGRMLAELTGPQSTVYSASFSPSSRSIVTASHNPTARVWNARGAQGSVRSASFSPDGQRIVTASEDHTGRV